MRKESLQGTPPKRNGRNPGLKKSIPTNVIRGWWKSSDLNLPSLFSRCDGAMVIQFFFLHPTWLVDSRKKKMGSKDQKCHQEVDGDFINFDVISPSRYYKEETNRSDQPLESYAIDFFVAQNDGHNPTVKDWSFANFKCDFFMFLLLMVQKSHSQPPFGCIRSVVNNGRYLPYQLVQPSAFNHQRLEGSTHINGFWRKVPEKSWGWCVFIYT